MRVTQSIVIVGVVLLIRVGVVFGADPATAKAGAFDSDGVKIAYIEAGEGEPVVLVHGLHSSAAMNWELPGTFARLAKKYHVVAMDLRGHGTSDKPEGEA